MEAFEAAAGLFDAGWVRWERLVVHESATCYLYYSLPALSAAG